MDNVCIPPELIEKTKTIAIRETKNGSELIDDSINREAKLLELFGGDTNLTTKVSEALEKAVISKRQNAAIKRFSEKFTSTGIAKQDEINKKILEALNQRKDKILTRDDLITIAQQQLKKQRKVDVSLETMQKIQTIKREAVDLEKVYKEAPTEANRMNWGRKEVEYLDFINEQKGLNAGIKGYFGDVKERVGQAYEKSGVMPATGRTLYEAGDLVFSGAFKGLKASMDMSAPLRQGLKVLSADPSTWAKSTKQGATVWKNIFNKKALDRANIDFRANVITDPMYKDMIDSGLAISGVEDFFPNSPLTKIPGLRNIFEASDQSYTTFVQGSRLDLFKNYVEMFKTANNGAMPDKKVMKGFARVANSVTGRGGLGKLEAASGFLNKVLFSARYQTANINTIRHAFDSSLPKEAQRIARRNLGWHLVLLVGLTSIASMFGDVGFDPREKTFGKVRIGNSKKWTDLTGGLASYLVPVFQVADKLSDGKPNKHGAESGKDILLGFLEGKLAPAPGALRDILDERSYGSDKVTPMSVLTSLVVPITAENAFEVATDEKSKAETWEKMLSVISDGLGASVSQPKAKRPGSYKSIIEIISGK